MMHTPTTNTLKTSLALACVAGTLPLAASHPPSSAAPAPAPPPIVIDGRFTDWSDAEPVLTDPADAPDSPVDFGSIACRADGRFVHLHIDLGSEVNIQHLRGRGLIVIDADNDPQTGLTQFGLTGADIIVELTPPSTREPSRPGMGIGLKSTTYNPDPANPTTPALIPYDIGLTFAPTYSSDQTEIRLARGSQLPSTAPIFEGSSFRAKLLFINESQLIRDETDVFECDLPPMQLHEPIGQQSDPLARAADSSIRTVNWNIEFGAIFENPDPFGRVLRGLDPELILIQEMPDVRSAAELTALLNREVPRRGGTWHVLIGDGGGDLLRCAIASRFPLTPIESLRLVAYPDLPDRLVRVAGAAAEIDGRNVMLVSLHLKCCGSAGSSEDLTRLQEVQLVRDAMTGAIEQLEIDAVILAGDLNLVGSRTPLDRFVEPLSPQLGGFLVAETMQIDGRSNATWSDPDQPFVPGRLDFMLIAGPDFFLGQSFSFDSQDLSPEWLQKHGILATDTAEASDHLPIVADLAIETDRR